MKNIILILLISLTFLSCKKKKEFISSHLEAYQDNLSKKYITISKAYGYEYSPDGKDSIVNENSFTRNLYFLENTLKEMESLNTQWDSLTFLAKKYDSIPLPSEMNMSRQERFTNKYIYFLKWKLNMEKLVELGGQDKNGKKLK